MILVDNTKIIVLQLFFLVSKIFSNTFNQRIFSHDDKTENQILSHELVPSNEQTLITKAKLFACNSQNICFAVKNFLISKNYTHNCNELYLGILFNSPDPKNASINHLIFGYLTNGISGISTLQQTTDSCFKYKKLISFFF